jgi:hypothetical protein
VELVDQTVAQHRSGITTFQAELAVTQVVQVGPAVAVAAGTTAGKLVGQMETVAETRLEETALALHSLASTATVTVAVEVLTLRLQLAVAVALTLAVAVETRQMTTAQEMAETELALVVAVVVLLALQAALVQTVVQSLRVECKNGKLCNIK